MKIYNLKNIDHASNTLNMLSLNRARGVLKSNESKMDFTNILVLVSNFTLKFAITQIKVVYSGGNIT